VTDTNGPVAVITGGTGGIATATAHRLADDGCRIALLDIDGERLDEVVTALRSSGGTAAGFVCDVSDAAAVDATMADVVAEFGGIDILVNAVGIGAYTPTEDHPLDLWDRVIAVNLTSGFLCVRAALSWLRESPRGRVVNITSRAAHKGRPGVVAYTAAKGGLLAMTRVLAAELGPMGITVNAVSPGTTVTPMVESMWDEEGQAQEAIDSGVVIEPMRLTQPEEIAGAIAYLCGPHTDHVTGATIHVNGGTFMP
jgi:3-oxoacyl-[acyl-carrier protein] reductase